MCMQTFNTMFGSTDVNKVTHTKCQHIAGLSMAVDNSEEWCLWGLAPKCQQSLQQTLGQVCWNLQRINECHRQFLPGKTKSQDTSKAQGSYVQVLTSMCSPPTGFSVWPSGLGALGSGLVAARGKWCICMWEVKARMQLFSFEKRIMVDAWHSARVSSHIFDRDCSSLEADLFPRNEWGLLYLEWVLSHPPCNRIQVASFWVSVWHIRIKFISRLIVRLGLGYTSQSNLFTWF